AHAGQHPVGAGGEWPGLQDGAVAQVSPAAPQPVPDGAGARFRPPYRSVREPGLLRGRGADRPDLTRDRRRWHNGDRRVRYGVAVFATPAATAVWRPDHVGTGSIDVSSGLRG